MRRATLVVGVGLMSAVFVRRGEAQNRMDLELEATPYGGTASGRMPPPGGCSHGPTAGVRYGGVGGRVRLRMHGRRDRRGEGSTVTVQGAVEERSHELLQPGSDMQRSLPADGVLAGVGFLAGIDRRWVGVRAGFVTFQTYGPPQVPCTSADDMAAMRCRSMATYPDLAWKIFPELVLRIGPPNSFHGMLGIGSPTVSTVLRPGAWVGLGYGQDDGLALALRAGLHRTLGDDLGLRVEAVARLPVSEHVGIAPGVAVMEGRLGRVGYEGGITLSGDFELTR